MSVLTQIVFQRAGWHRRRRHPITRDRIGFLGVVLQYALLAAIVLAICNRHQGFVQYVNSLLSW